MVQSNDIAYLKAKYSAKASRPAYKRQLWTEAERDMLRELYANTETSVLVEKLGRSAAKIFQQAARLGLKKSDEYIQEHVYRIDAFTGMNSRFKKGQTPVNKGKAMKPELYAKCAPTMFKPGTVPPNTKHDGARSIRKDKRGTPYEFERISLSVWEPVKNLVWKQHNGPIPKGHCVRFINGNTLDCRIENLECITRKENMMRNTIHNYPPELVGLILTTAQLTRKINKKTKTQNGQEQTK
jgi:hypothetical protein